MSSVILTGDTSGTLNLAAPLIAGTNTQTLVAATGTLAPIVSGTYTAASGTSVDFTGIPSWVKRITVMLTGLSLNANANFLLQVGTSSGFTTTGYTGAVTVTGNGVATQGIQFSNGITIFGGSLSNITTGVIQIALSTPNLWVFSGTYGLNNAIYAGSLGGYVSLAATLDRVRITSTSGTDTFDAGSINILYE